MLEVGKAFLERRKIFFSQRSLIGAALHLERADGRDEHRRFGIQTADAALDVEELFRAEIRTESRFGDDHIAERESRTRRKNAVATVCDVAERARVHQCRASLESLYQVRA